MEEIEFSLWLFEGRPRQGKNVLPDGLNWLCYFAGNSKSHCENSISFIFLESPHQVDMKNVVKCQKHFFSYFNVLKTHGVLTYKRTNNTYKTKSYAFGTRFLIRISMPSAKEEILSEFLDNPCWKKILVAMELLLLRANFD